jgi:hypothetical protein
MQKSNDERKHSKQKREDWKIGDKNFFRKSSDRKKKQPVFRTGKRDSKNERICSFLKVLR